MRTSIRRLPWLLPLLGSMAVPAADPALQVEVRPAAELLFHPQHSAPAEVTPLNDTRLSAEINARVAEIRVRVGDRVDTGELLVRLDCRDYDSRVQAQQASRRALEIRRRLARTQLERARDLKRARNISDEEVDRRETELQALEAELAAQTEAETQARLNQGRCGIRAPFTAAVTERLAGIGTLAAPGTPLLHLVQLDAAEVSAHISPRQLKPGIPDRDIEFTYLDGRYPLALARTLPVVDPATRTRELRLRFTGESAPPGASGRLVWRSPAPHLPADLPVRRDGRLGVFLFNDGHARFHPLPGALEGRPATTDLPPDARVIVAGRDNLEDGMAVQVGSDPASNATAGH